MSRKTYEKSNKYSFCIFLLLGIYLAIVGNDVFQVKEGMRFDQKKGKKSH